MRTGYDVTKEIPAFYLAETDTEKLAAVFQYGIDNMRADIAKCLDQISYETAEEQTLDAMLFEAGWILELDLTELQKRKLLKVVRSLNLRKGTPAGHIWAALTILGLTITIEQPRRSAWRLGVAGRTALGDSGNPGECILSASEHLWFFRVHAGSGITTQQEAFLTALITYMIVAPEDFVIIKDL